MITFSKLGQYGRFGNQLWQIASTIGIATKMGVGYCFPKWQYQRYFRNNLPPFIGDSYETFYELNSYYNDLDLPKNRDWDLVGYFQSYKYFEHCKKLIKDYFSPLGTWEQEDFVSVHVRRGDYLNLTRIHPVLPLDYYKEAIRLFPGRDFVIFSDDIDWCKENFIGGKYFYSVGHSEESDFFDMMYCKDNIIANSSFSWWAAWLNPNPDKIVVAPKVWVNGEKQDDRVPPEWIRL